MTTYRAVVKYPVGASRDEMVSALRAGLETIVVELVEEHEVEPETVDEWLTSAIDTAYLTAADD